MSDLPVTLTYFGSLQNVSRIMSQAGLLLVEPHQLNDPFLPDKDSSMAFSVKSLFDSSVKYISHAILGKTAPKGQPNHPLQKAIMRWRMENRFNDESEVKEALQGLLPAMVEQAFNEAKGAHQQWANYVTSKRVVPFYEKYGELTLWETKGLQHKGAAIKFKCEEDSIFKSCYAVNYQRSPATTVDEKSYIEHMAGTSTEIEFDPLTTLLTQNISAKSLKEWRLIVDEAELEDPYFPFPLSLVQSIYIGALVPEKMAEQFKNQIAKLSSNILVYHASCKQNEYELAFNKISDNASADEVELADL